MALSSDDFALTEDEINALNAFIARTVEAIYANNPEEDPLDGLSVIFTFTPGLGREIEIDLAGHSFHVGDTNTKS